jgi:multiple sugar transport system permease protein
LIKSLSEIVADETNFIPQQFTLENYKQIFSQEPLFGRWLFNSVFVAIWITGFNLLFNSMASYALARIRFPGNQVCFLLFWLF